MKRFLKFFGNGKLLSREKGFVDFDLMMFLVQILAVISLIIGGLWFFKSYREGKLKEDAVSMVVDLSEFYKKEYPQAEREIALLENAILQAIEEAEDRDELLRCLYLNKDNILKQSLCLNRKDVDNIREYIIRKIKN